MGMTVETMVATDTPALEQVRDCDLGDREITFDIDLQGLVPHLVGGVEQRPKLRIGGRVVDHDVKPAKGCGDLRDRGRNLRAIARVAGQGNGPAAALIDGVRHRLNVFASAAVDRDGGAGAGIGPGDGFSDSTRATRDESNPAAQAESDGWAHVRLCAAVAYRIISLAEAR